MLVLLFLTVVIFISCSDDDVITQDDTSNIVEQLQGEWTSDQVSEFVIPIPNPTYEKVYQVEIFTFVDNANRLVNTSFADEELTIPLLRYISNGPFTVLRKSGLFENTWEADFGNTSQTIEVLTDDPAFFDLFGFASCGIEASNVVYNIDEGCSIFPGIDECVEKDIIQIANGELRFGTRAPDICTNRVTTLQEVRYRKQRLVNVIKFI